MLLSNATESNRRSTKGRAAEDIVKEHYRSGGCDVIQGGAPDLFKINRDNPAECEFLEVKSGGSRLNPRQRKMHAALRRAGLAVRIVLVVDGKIVDQEQIVTLCNTGKSCRQVATDLGIDPVMVSDIYMNHTGKRKPRSNVDRARVVALRRARLTYKQIGEQLGIPWGSAATIYYTDCHPSERKKIRDRTKQLADEALRLPPIITALRADGKSYKRIGRELGISTDRALALYNDHNRVQPVPRRNVDRQLIVSLRDKGLSFTKIGIQVGLSRQQTARVYGKMTKQETLEYEMPAACMTIQPQAFAGAAQALSGAVL